MSDSIFPRTARVGIVFSGFPLYEVLPDPAYKDGTGFGEPLAIAPDDEDATVEICGQCYGPLYLYTDEDGSETYCPECTICRLPVDNETSF